MTPTPSTAPSMSDVAVLSGATDVFALREVGPGQLVHIDGVGRGEGWAGNVDVSEEREPNIKLARQQLVRIVGDKPKRIFGPYWQCRAALVPAGDFVIVMGGDRLSDDDEDLHRAAAEAAWVAGEVPASKRLADDLEVSQAIVSVATVDRSSLANAAKGLAAAAAAALACEFGAVLLPGKGGLHLANTSWQPLAEPEEIADAIRRIPIGDERLFVADDLHEMNWARHPLDFENGLVTQCAVKIDVPGGTGILVVAHRGEAARGFTALCRRVATGIGEAGSDLLRDVASR